MATSYCPTLVSTIMFDGIDKVEGDFLVSLWPASYRAMSKVVEHFLLKELVPLGLFRVSPFCIAVLSVKLHSLGMVTWHFVSEHVNGGILV